MLLTTALSLGDVQVADQARKHFADYTKVVMELSKVISSAVVEDLHAQELPVIENADDVVREEVRKIWESA